MGPRALPDGDEGGRLLRLGDQHDDLGQPLHHAGPRLRERPHQDAERRGGHQRPGVVRGGVHAARGHARRGAHQEVGPLLRGSTAVSIVDHIRALTTPTNEGDWFSMGVCTDGNPYGLPEDMIFSMPCRSTGDGDYTLVPEKEIKRTPWLDAKIAASVDELSKERGCVQHLFGEMGGVGEVTEDTMLPGEN